jgi:tRNA1Val (adenine37-N6)-methyltransferase
VSPLALDLVQQRRAELERLLGEPITLDAVTEEYHLFQRRKGYRYSTDDLLTAWFAITRTTTSVAHALDLGIGIGCVGLSIAWHFRHAALVGVETQDIAVRLLKENLWANQLEGRVTLLHQDLRQATLPVAHFDLVTASPPYFPPGSGILPADSQLAHCRFELNGDINDYARVAARALAPHGRFVFCFPSAGAGRAAQALLAARLHVREECLVIPREGSPPLFSLFNCGHEETARVTSRLVVRHRDGTRSAEMNAARAVLGFSQSNEDASHH